MKYGETLYQRSIPEWQAYNVDYNDIKTLIKDRTTRTGPSLIVVPGHRDKVAETDFEDELMEILQAQHEGVDMFVRSKAGEIKRRLEHLHKIVVQLRRRIDGSFKKIPIKRMERFARVETDVMNAGEELQSLARFLAAQDEAFRKLLKKYKKWTGSSRLEKRFRKEVLAKPSVFAQANIDPLISQYEDVLGTLRVPFSNGLTWGLDGNATSVEEQQAPSTFFSPIDWRDSSSLDSNSASSQLAYLCAHGSNLELDAGLAILPLGPDGAGCATYWAHVENLLQLHILMLQHTKLRVHTKNASEHQQQRRRSSTGEMLSPASSRQPSLVPGRVTGTGSSNDADVDLVILDDAESYAKRRSGMTIEDIEGLPGHRPQQAVVSIRLGLEGDALVDIGGPGAGSSGNGSQEENEKSLHAYVSKRKFLGPLLDSTKTILPDESTVTFKDGSTDAKAQDRKNLEKVKDWLVERSDVNPLARILACRTRFIGLNNSADSGLWATLDKDICLQKVERELFEASPTEGDEPGPHGDADLLPFPHVVLTLRWEGQRSPPIVKMLDNSHLVERIPGFSIETHAVSVLCKPNSMPAPYWMQALQKDIRKIPDNKSLSRRGTNSPESLDHRPASNSATSHFEPSSGFSAAAAPSSPATSANEHPQTPLLKTAPMNRRKRKPRRQYTQQWEQTNTQAHDLDVPRYWNEFDEGEECHEEEAYTILIDPNASEPLSELWKVIATQTKVFSEKVQTWFTPKSESKRLKSRSRPRQVPNERTSLLNRLDSNSVLHKPPLNGDENLASISAGSTDPSSPHTRSPSITSSSTSSPESSTPALYSTRYHKKSLTRLSLHPSLRRPSLRPRYSTFPSFHMTRDPLDPLAVYTAEQRDALLIKLSAAAFVASFMLLVLAAALEGTRRRKYAVGAGIGVAVGIIGSLMCTAGGVGLSEMRRKKGWMGRVQVGLVAGVVLVGCGVLGVIFVGGD